MAPEQLKASILQYAFKGKLVEQNIEEGNGKELYSSIKLNKEKLIKEKKIKKDKPLDEITEDEIPFDIPDNWTWVRVGDMGSWASGATPSRTNPDFYGGNIPWLKTGDLNDGYIDDVPEYITEIALEKTSVRLNPKGSVLMAMYGATIGKLGILNTPMTTNQACCACITFDGVFNRYLFYFLMSQRPSYIGMAEGGAQPNISKEKIVASIMPLPPLEEQHRIVAKIEEMLPFVDRYAEAYEKLEKFNAKFPEDMKKSILQYAIQGKLVEQRAEEGTAEELYQQIQEERSKYKIKEYEIDEVEEMPFDIPETWKWVHLQDIVKKTIKRGKSPKYADKSEIQVFAQKCNVKTGGINMNLALFLDEKVVEKYPVEEFVCNGDIVINSTGGGTMGRVGVFHDSDRIDNMKIVPDGHVTVIRACDSIDYKFLYYFIKHNQHFLETQGEGSTNQTELKPNTIASLLLPLPPYEEQRRIVAKIEELLPYCDQLIK